MSTIEAMNNNPQLASVRVVAEANQSVTYYNGPTNNGVGATVTYATGTLTIDSVTVNLNDYVLLAGQTAAYENGIYQCIVVGATGIAAVLQRRGDFQCIEQIQTGAFATVKGGTAFGGSIWTVVEPLPAAIGNPVVSGANNITFVDAGTATSGTYLVAANNLSDVASAPTALTNLGIHSAKATGAGGSATVTITDASIAAANVVVAAIQSSANAVTIEKVTPGAGSLVVLCSGDPGGNVISYIATAAAQ